MAIARDIEEKERAAAASSRPQGTPTPPHLPSSAASAAKKGKLAKVTDEGKTAHELPPASSSSSAHASAPADMSALFSALLTGQQQMLQLLAQLVVTKKEAKELPPPLSGYPSFIHPGASSSSSSSSSSAGAQAAARYSTQPSVKIVLCSRFMLARRSAFAIFTPNRWVLISLLTPFLPALLFFLSTRVVFSAAPVVVARHHHYLSCICQLDCGTFQHPRTHRRSANSCSGS